MKSKIFHVFETVTSEVSDIIINPTSNNIFYFAHKSKHTIMFKLVWRDDHYVVYPYEEDSKHIGIAIASLYLVTDAIQFINACLTLFELRARQK